MGAYDCLRAGNRIGNLQLATIPPCLLNLWMIRRQNPTRGYSSCARCTYWSATWFALAAILLKAVER